MTLPSQPQASAQSAHGSAEEMTYPLAVSSKTYPRRRFLRLAGFASGGFGLAHVAPAIANLDQPLLADSAPGQPVIQSANRPIKVGILHSLSGTMAISEVSALDAENLAIQEINAAGGVLGRPVEAIVEDGASDWPTFQDKLKKLIQRDRVSTIFGVWTSASRKAILPTLEVGQQQQLWYPLSYEGQECSNAIFYFGSLPNQQVEVTADWALRQFRGKPYFLLGSDYVFPRVVNTILKAKLRGKVSLVGEDYLPLGNVELAEIINRIRQTMPQGGVIYNSLNGDSNVVFFKLLFDLGLRPPKYPVISLNLWEPEVLAIGSTYMQGHYAAWSYFQSVDTPANRRFVAAFKAAYGTHRVLSEPLATAYTAVWMWKHAVEKAGSITDMAKIRRAAIGLSFDAPEGRVTMMPNHHITKTIRIGQIQADGQFQIVYQTPTPIQPQPWNQQIEATRGYACDWRDPKKGGKYKLQRSR